MYFFSERLGTEKNLSQTLVSLAHASVRTWRLSETYSAAHFIPIHSILTSVNLTFVLLVPRQFLVKGVPGVPQFSAPV